MEKLLDLIHDEDLFASKKALILGIVVIIPFLVALDSYIPGWATWVKFLAATLLILAWILVWIWHYTKVPKVTKSKIGIILFIATESNKTRERVEKDLVFQLQKLINESGLSDLTEIVLAKNYQAKRVLPWFEEFDREAQMAQKIRRSVDLTSDDTKNIIKLHKKSRALLYVGGNINERYFNNENQYVLDLSAVVFHADVRIEYQRKIIDAFGKVWYRTALVNEKREWEGFQALSSHYYFAFRYLLGIALLFSGHPNPARRIHSSLEKDIVNKKHSSIWVDLEKFLSLDYFLSARELFFRGGDITEIKQYLETSLSYDKEYTDVYLTRAIVEFIADGDPDTALKTIEIAAKYSETEDWTWKYSEAFLQLYKGNFKRGIKLYNEIAGHSYDSEPLVVDQILRFNEDFVTKNPSQIQSYFILGFIYMKKMSNYPEALRYFELFLEKADKGKFKVLVDRANHYKKQLEKGLGLQN